MSKRRWALFVAGIFLVVVLALLVLPRPDTRPARPLVVNEAVRTLLYLPLYHAVQRGYFRDAGLDVSIVTGGTATASFAALLSGEAQFSQADPMYVPISRSQGANTIVVAQVVSRIAVWGVATDSIGMTNPREFLRGRAISTHVRPMTAYTYAVRYLTDLGLRPDVNVLVIQNQPGTELTPLLTGRARLAFTLEPQVSQAVAQGASVVVSFPRLIGDQVFTGLMTTRAYLDANRDVVLAVVQAYQRSLDDIALNPDGAVATARAYFPQLDSGLTRRAVLHLLADSVFPRSVEIPIASWDRAMAVRVAAGDLAAASSRDSNSAVEIMREAATITIRR